MHNLTEIIESQGENGMIRIVFFDKIRETFCAVGEVVKIENTAAKINGRYTKVWLLCFLNGKTKSFKQKDFDIYLVEI